jgi:hypothetical protein
MLFHAMMEFCLDLLRSKFWLIGGMVHWAVYTNQILMYHYTFILQQDNLKIQDVMQITKSVLRFRN